MLSSMLTTLVLFTVKSIFYDHISPDRILDTPFSGISGLAFLIVYCLMFSEWDELNLVGGLSAPSFKFWAYFMFIISQRIQQIFVHLFVENGLSFKCSWFVHLILYSVQCWGRISRTKICQRICCHPPGKLQVSTLYKILLCIIQQDVT